LTQTEAKVRNIQMAISISPAITLKFLNNKYNPVDSQKAIFSKLKGLKTDDCINNKKYKQVLKQSYLRHNHFWDPKQQTLTSLSNS